jgi:hypothetical protein
MPRLHLHDDRLQGARVVGVAGEYLVAQRKAVKSDDNGNAYLLAVGPVIARIAALRLRIALGLAFKIRAGERTSLNYEVRASKASGLEAPQVVQMTSCVDEV